MLIDFGSTGLPVAVKNLMTMAKNVYVHAGSKSGLERVLRGVKVEVLGPPTVKQHEAVKGQRSKDPDEFWQLQASALQFANGSVGGVSTGEPLFPKHVRSRGPRFPIDARWLIYHARQLQGEQLLQIVRMLDDAMNNTSVILLFEVGDVRLLFPGDAQIENWEFALSNPKITKRLEGVNVYKVGHHGSLNATPKSLWKLFDNRSKEKNAPNRLQALMSTMPCLHGDVKTDTEVPRRTLVSALKSETKLFSTDDLKDKFFKDTEVDFA